MKALVVGAAGRMGRATAALLARRPRTAVTLAVRRDEDARRLGALSRGSNAEAVALDLMSGRAADVFADHDVVLGCAGPAFATELRALEAAIEAGTPYVSLCDDPGAFTRARALDGAARAAGAAAVPGCGLSPGLTGLLFAHAAATLDEISSASLAAAGAVGDGMGPAALSQLQALRFEAPQPVYFPEPVGWVETFLVPHPETEVFPEVVEARRGLTEKGAMDVVRAAAAVRAHWRGAHRLAPAARILPPRGPAWSAARVDVHGIRSSAPATVTVGVVDRLANLAPATLVRAAIMLASGDVPPGVHALHEIADQRRVLAALADSGVRIARLEPEPV